MSIGEKLKTIAQHMRSVYGKGRAIGYDEGYKKGYDAGGIAGGIAAREVCLLNHYVDSGLGNGSSMLEIPIPFAPDVVAVYSTNPFSGDTPNVFKSLLYDSRACYKYNGFVQYCTNTGQSVISSLPTGKADVYFTYQDGIWRFAIPGSNFSSVVWKNNVRYTVMAVRYADENTEQLVREQIALLPDVPPSGSNGTLTYTQAAIDRYFTAEQWQELIAEKPNWRFVMQ